MSRQPTTARKPSVSTAAPARAQRDGTSLETAIGLQVRELRNRLGMTVVDLARQADLSPGMLSKIENGQTSPSLSTLQNLARALNTPVTALFRKFEEQRDATFVKAGDGLAIDRRGTKAGHDYALLGHSIGKQLAVEPYLITVTEMKEVNPTFQHAGFEFLYLLEGAVDYRHGQKVYEMEPGDSLFFDAEAPHGPEALRRLPIRMLSIMVHQHDTE
ncbi:Transcriptional regulator, MerR family [Caenispirillum salinarum AK4]|uniref:Transcriptional regulator, MerR family n=1 Tax=Caenispirillum salinarum AK4 TaxID=1238182 RepID=K9HUT7_9PROT|nr:XRE family transcriptional regulator [Caenispirillum salinarum]EKV32021.1 Transcriptional regulator, MerR family [Caenispirillum salinarum AK4]